MPFPWRIVVSATIMLIGGTVAYPSGWSTVFYVLFGMCAESFSVRLDEWMKARKAKAPVQLQE
jgi:hypothetical protein